MLSPWTKRFVRILLLQNSNCFVIDFFVKKNLHYLPVVILIPSQVPKIYLPPY